MKFSEICFLGLVAIMLVSSISFGQDGSKLEVDTTSFVNLSDFNEGCFPDSLWVNTSDGIEKHPYKIMHNFQPNYYDFKNTVESVECYPDSAWYANNNMMDIDLKFNLNYPTIIYMFNVVSPNELRRVLDISGISHYWIIDGGYGFNLTKDANKDFVVRKIKRLLWKKW